MESSVPSKVAFSGNNEKYSKAEARVEGGWEGEGNEDDKGDR